MFYSSGPMVLQIVPGPFRFSRSGVSAATASLVSIARMIEANPGATPGLG